MKQRECPTCRAVSRWRIVDDENALVAWWCQLCLQPFGWQEHWYLPPVEHMNRVKEVV